MLRMTACVPLKLTVPVAFEIGGQTQRLRERRCTRATDVVIGDDEDRRRSLTDRLHGARHASDGQVREFVDREAAEIVDGRSELLALSRGRSQTDR